MLKSFFGSNFCTSFKSSEHFLIPDTVIDNLVVLEALKRQIRLLLRACG